MRYLLILPLFILISTSCSKTDKEKVVGTWGFYELKRGPEKKVVFSLDEKKQDEIIENEIKLQKEMYQGMPFDEKVIRENAKKQFDNMTKLTFTFSADGKLKIDTHLPDKSSNQETKYTIDDKKKELVIKSDAREIKYTYKFDGDKMIWNADQEELVMINKD